jgi:hypothetical protein
MEKKKAEWLFGQLETLNAYRAPADSREALLRCLCVDRIILDLAHNEARLRLEKPLGNGVRILKVRNLGPAERDSVRIPRRGRTPAMILESTLQAISFMNELNVESLKGLSSGDVFILNGLTALLSKEEE